MTKTNEMQHPLVVKVKEPEKELKKPTDKEKAAMHWQTRNLK
jgi:hypothetical protein